jgi:tetratricopeptide (TPR) repeat protein
MLGHFSIGENALMGAWAREEVQSWGIFRYGVSLKLINQNFGGLQSSAEMGIGDIDRGWTSGVDVGLTFQPVHAPIFKVFSLRYLLPLRFGLTVQNLVQPVWQGEDGRRDRFPRVIRYGISYRWILKDWLPETWEVLSGWAREFYITTVLDREHIPGREPGSYFGLEGHFPLTRSGFGIYPRIGFNNRSEGASLGIGLSLPFAASTTIRIDYAYGYHPYLPEDSRFFLTLQMGRDKGSEYFSELSKREGIEEKQRIKNLYRIVAEYPNDHVVEAAIALADVEDSTRARRYYDLTGGIGRAVWLFRETKTLLKIDKVNIAKKRAQDVAEEYAQIFVQPEHTLNDEDLLNYAEALFITDRTEAALSVLVEIEEPSLRYYYLQGISELDLQDWEGAIDAFREAVKRYEEEQDLNSMVALSFLHMAEALFMTGQYESAVMTLEIVLQNYSDRLHPDYPRYPVFRDEYIVDDAQFLLGLCHVRMGNYREGVSRMMETVRFYPDLEYGLWTDAMAESLIETVRTANWNRLDSLIDQVSLEYVNSHAW